MHRLIFVLILLLPTNALAQSLQLQVAPLQLTTDTNTLIDLLDIQDKSLDELETSWNMMQVKISTLESLNKDLTLQLEDSQNLILELQNNLNTIKDENERQAEYQKLLQDRLAEANRQYRAATVAGIISGVALGTGVSLMIGGGIKQNNAVVYSGLGITGAAIVIWTTGKLCHWW